MSIQVKKLKRLVNDLQRALENIPDSKELETVSNTYFLGQPKYFLSISSEGYINLDEIIEGTALLEEASIDDMFDKMTALKHGLPETYEDLVDELRSIAIADNVDEHDLEEINVSFSVFDILSVLAEVLTEEGWDKAAMAILRARDKYQ